MSESVITERCRRLFKRLKIRHGVYALKSSDRYTSGVPDFLLSVNGAFVAIELKDKGQKPRKIQEYTLREIERSGGFALSTDSYEEVEEFMDLVLVSTSTVEVVRH